MKGCKDDSEKPDWSLVPVGVMRSIVEVLTYGAKKYSCDNWQLVQNPKDRYYAACQRHLDAWRSGERVDEESGLPHLAHAACCVMFLLWFDEVHDWVSL